MHPTLTPEAVDTPQARIVATAARDSVAYLRQWFDRVYVLRQPPEIPNYDSRRAAREAAHGALPLAARPVTQSFVEVEALALRAALADAIWQPLTANGSIEMLDPWPAFCEAGRCSAIHNGIGQYFDNNHVTNAGALRARDVFRPVFARDARQTALTRPANQ